MMLTSSIRIHPSSSRSLLRKPNATSSTLRSNHSRLICRAAAPQQLLIYVPPHSLVQHWVAVLRNKATPTPMFRAAAAELGRILVYEATRDWLPTIQGQVDTPLGTADVTFIDPTKPLVVVPVLRAGLVLLEQASSILPATITYHVGYVRNDDTLECSCYLNKLPPSFSSDDLILVSDPMLATGGTMVAVIQDIVSRGANPANIRIVATVAAPPALKKLGDKFPALKIYCGMIDAEVDERGYIVPGLGDMGDRAFGTQ